MGGDDGGWLGVDVAQEDVNGVGVEVGSLVEVERARLKDARV